MYEFKKKIVEENVNVMILFSELNLACKDHICTPPPINNVCPK